MRKYLAESKQTNVNDHHYFLSFGLSSLCPQNQSNQQGMWATCFPAGRLTRRPSNLYDPEILTSLVSAQTPNHVSEGIKGIMDKNKNGAVITLWLRRYAN